MSRSEALASAAIKSQAEPASGTPETIEPARARKMLNEKQVLLLIPVSRMTLYRMEKAGRFPRSTYISPNRRFWYEDEIVAWQNAVDEFNPNRGRGRRRPNHSEPSHR